MSAKSKPTSLVVMERLVTAVNPLVRVLLKSPLHGLMSKTTMLIEVRGRKTGNVYTMPVSYVKHGDSIRCLTAARWAANLRGGAAARVCVRGEWQSVHAEAISGADPAHTEQVGQGIETLLAEVPRDAPFYEIKLDAAGKPPADEVARAARETWLVTVAPA